LLAGTLYRRFFSKNPEERRLIRSLRYLLGFHPGNLSVYKLAFSHRSLALETANGVRLSNERLEYLGDAVLGAVVAELLFKRFPTRDEGFLTEMRSRIVSRENLKILAVKVGIDELLIRDAVPGSFRSMYGDAFEALIGAIYLDKGYTTTRKFIMNQIIRHHVDLHEIEQTEKNFKSLILNWGQKERHNVVFEVVDEEDQKSRLIKVRLLIDDKEVSTGTDYVKKKAEQIASEIACKELGIL
jgi:ribonuclease III